MRKVYLDVAGRTHTLYNGLILFPPEGYEVVTEDVFWDKTSKAISNIDFIYSLQKKTLSKLIPVNLVKAYLERFKKPPDGTDLTYATGQLVFRKEPWVVDLEFVTQVAGYSIRHFKRYRKLIEKVLASKYCKKITSVTEAGKKTVLANMNCRGFEHKLEVVRPAIPKKNFIKDYSDRGKVKLLFVGSANIPKDFEIKGGKEVLEAFSHLNKEYDNLELVIRSYIPQHIKEKYKIKNIRIIDEIIPWEELEQEFESSDVFLFPSHNTPALAILDAMSYELPVITTDVWANPELVENGKTGFIIKKSEMIKHYVENFIPDWSSPYNMRAYKTHDPKVVEELVEKTSILIENLELRRRMGKAGRQEIESGKFSIEKRNKKLKKIFDEATGGS